MASPDTGGQRLSRSLRRLARRLPEPIRDAVRDRRSSRSEPAVAAAPVAAAPSLTVVVVARNAADYLTECLASLQAQTFRDFEVLVVDDRSSDETVAVARSWTDSDDRFRLVAGPQTTQPAAWNAGAGAARGKFLAFIEATDTVPPAAYADLVASLRSTGSDFAAGGLQDMRMGRPRRPAWVLATHDLDRPARTLQQFGEAALDVALGNRVFRTSFWRDSVTGFAEWSTAGFPEASDHTEPYAVVAATLAATRFDFLKRVAVVRHPRQARSTIAAGPAGVVDLDHRLHWLERTWELIQHRSDPDPAGRLLGRLIDIELGDLTAGAAEAGPEYQQRLQATAAHLLAAADDETWRHVRVERKLRLWHAAHGQWAEIVGVTEHFRLEGLLTETVVDGAAAGGEPRIRIAGTPPAALGPVPPPTACLDLGDSETVLTGCIESLHWDGPVLSVTGWAFIRGIDLAGIEPQITARLTEIESRAEHRVAVTRVGRPAANRWARLRYHDVAPSGFTLTIDSSDLPTQPGRWQLGLEVRAAGVTRVGLLLATVPTSAAGRGASRAVTVADDPVRVFAHLDREHGFCLQVRRDVARVTDLWAEGPIVGGRLLALGDAPGALVSMLAVGPHGEKAQAGCFADGRFRLELPATAAPTVWQVRALDAGGRRHRIAWPVEASVADDPPADAAGRWLRTPRGQVELGSGPLVEAVDVRLDGTQLTVRVHGRSTDWAGMRLVGPQVSVPVGAVEDEAGGLRLRFDLEASRWGGPVLPLPTDDYRIITADGWPLLAAEAVLTQLPKEQLTAAHLVEIGRGAGRELQIALSGPRQETERGSYALHRLALAYLDADPAPRDAVLFQCYRGESATDSQRAIHQELRGRQPALELRWGVHDLSVPLPDGGQPLLIESAAWFEALAASRFLCRNIDFERYFVHRPHQRYLQTFHGYPFKSMGASLWRAQGRPEAVIAVEQQRRSSAWDAILVPADFCVELYRREYGFTGQALVTGYPRNDALVNADAATTRAQVLATLGIPPEKTVVLYAPTWRDTVATSAWTAAMFDELDLAALTTALGDDYAVLLRAHNYNLRDGLTLPAGAVWDVSSYPEVNDLILAADVAVLDYSSLRFDWLITDKPVLFFVPDLADYLSARTALFDYEPTAPGPLLATTAEVAAALHGLDQVAAEYAAARADFNARFNTLHDGQAGRRVVDAFFD